MRKRTMKNVVTMILVGIIIVMSVYIAREPLARMTRDVRRFAKYGSEISDYEKYEWCEKEVDSCKVDDRIKVALLNELLDGVERNHDKDEFRIIGSVRVDDVMYDYNFDVDYL